MYAAPSCRRAQMVRICLSEKEETNITQSQLTNAKQNEIILLHMTYKVVIYLRINTHCFCHFWIFFLPWLNPYQNRMKVNAYKTTRHIMVAHLMQDEH